MILTHIFPLLVVVALVYTAATLFGVVTLPILIRRKNIRIPWLLFIMAFGPAVVTGLLIKDPWFAVNGVWRWIRFILLFSWIPAFVELERRRRFIYENLFAKWMFRWTLFSLLLGLSLWTAHKVNPGELVHQAKASSNSWGWVVFDGEDIYLFVRVENSPMHSIKIADSVGGDAADHPYDRPYSISWVGNRVEVRYAGAVSEYYDPKTDISEYTDESGKRRRFNHSSNINEKWNPKTKTWDSETTTWVEPNASETASRIQAEIAKAHTQGSVKNPPLRN